MMPRLLWRSAGSSSFGPTLCRLTGRGTTMPCSFPSVLIHIHRALWIWPVIIRTVRRGAPGTVAPHSSWGKFSTRKTVTRLLVLHASSSISRWSSADFITTLHGVIKLTPNILVRCGLNQPPHLVLYLERLRSAFQVQHVFLSVLLEHLPNLLQAKL